MTVQIRCHYDVLSIPRDADAVTLKKAYRKLAIKWHPDKNVNKSEDEQNIAVSEFKLIQAAYECLSDPTERKWYDEHREMILRGGLHGSGDSSTDGSTFLFDIVPYQFAGCYDGYDDTHPEGFYSIYNEVFVKIFQGEKDGFISEGNIDIEKMSNFHLSEVNLGNSTSSWESILAFYNSWEGFTSCLSYAWADDYHLNDIREAPSRQIRRLMEDENKKKRKAAKKERIDEICALVRFVKKRDPRVKKQQEKTFRAQAAKELERKREAMQRQKDMLAAKEEWRVGAERAMAEQEAADLNAGRVRLADLDSDDEYDYRVKRGSKKKGRRKGKSKTLENDHTHNEEDALVDLDSTLMDGQNESIEGGASNFNADKYQSGSSSSAMGVFVEGTVADDIVAELCNQVDDVEITSNGCTLHESSEEDEPDSWRCECCRKDFKSSKQFENHERSKKHKDMLKKYEKKFQRESLLDIMDELVE